MTHLYYSALLAVIGANIVAIVALALTTKPHTAGLAKTLMRRLAPQAAKLPEIRLERGAEVALVIAVTFAVLVMLQAIADVLGRLL